MSVLQALQSTSLYEYASALDDLRAQIDRGELEDVDDESFTLICRAYQPHALGHEDVRAAIEKVLDCLSRNADVMVGLSEGVERYAEAFADGRCDPSGFMVVMGSLELAAKVDLEMMVEELGRDKAAIAALDQYGDMLSAMEGAKHSAYWILRVVGNRHLQRLEEMMPELSAEAAGFVLHALDEFVGDSAVIQFYERYIAALNGWLEAEADDGARAVLEGIRDDARRYMETVAGG